MLYWAILIFSLGFALIVPKIRKRRKLNSLNEIENKQGESTSIYLQRGQEHFNSGHYEVAIEEYNKAINLDKNCYEAHIGKGMVREKIASKKPKNEQKKFYKKAIEDYSKSIDIYQFSPKAYAQRGLIYYNIFNDIDSAFKDFKAAVKIEPLNNEIREILTQMYVDKKMYNEIIDYYTILLESDPSNAFFYDERGNAYYELKQFDLALKDYNNALLQNTQDKYVYLFEIGEVYLDSGDYEKSIDYFTKSIEVNKNNALGYYKRGLAYEKLNNMESAIEDLKKSLNVYKFKDNLSLGILDDLKRMQKLHINK